MIETNEQAITVATWNVERVAERSWKKLPGQKRAIARVEADIWVLTETSAWYQPAEGFHALHCPPLTGRRPDERMVSIWSRWPLTPTDLKPRARGSVSAVVHSPLGPVTVFGSVIPYANDHGPDGTSRMWAERRVSAPMRCCRAGEASDLTDPLWHAPRKQRSNEPGGRAWG